MRQSWIKTMLACCHQQTGAGHPSPTRVCHHISAAGTAREQSPGGGCCATGPWYHRQAAVHVGQRDCGISWHPALERPHPCASPGHAEPQSPAECGVHAMHWRAGAHSMDGLGDVSALAAAMGLTGGRVGTLTQELQPHSISLTASCSGWLCSVG